MARRAEIEEFAKLHHQACVAMGHRLPLAEVELMARTMFPAGSLPGGTDPITFTTRELEIFRHLLWETEETWHRHLHAEVERCDRIHDAERAERVRVEPLRGNK